MFARLFKGRRHRGEGRRQRRIQNPPTYHLRPATHQTPETRTQSFLLTYHIRPPLYQILTTFLFNNIPAFKG